MCIYRYIYIYIHILLFIFIVGVCTSGAMYVCGCVDVCISCERRVQSRSTPSEGKPGSFGVLLPRPGSATGHLVEPGVTILFSTSRYTLVLIFKPTSKMWGGMMWPSLETIPKTITIARNFVFITLGTSLLFAEIQICILRVLAMVLLS